MAIENRNLLAGTRLVANYKKQRFVCTVEAGEAVNGWRFWSLEGEAPAAPTEPAKPKAKKTAKTKRLIHKVPNHQGDAEGQRAATGARPA